MEIWIPLLLFIIGFVALFLELFIPAAGIIGACGILSMITGTVLGYRHFGRNVDSLFLAGTLIGTPVLIVLGLKLFPKTFVGKKLILKQSLTREAGFSSSTDERYEELPGKEGKALTVLRPSGMVLIDGRKYSVVTSGEMIEKDAVVRVKKVEGSRIVVQRVKQEDV